MGKEIRVGARGSMLSKLQADKVIEILGRKGLSAIFVPVKTEGDRNRNTPLFAMRDRGIFVKALEEAIVSKNIDVAVHSAKDVPTDIPEDFEIIAFLKREEVQDIIISRFSSLSEIPENAKIGTSSVRRQFFLSLKRPDFRFVPIRGNVDTRIKKWENGEVDALVLAGISIKRVGFSVPHFSLPASDFPPSPGQGALCLETRKNSEFNKVLRTLNDSDTEIAITTERLLLKKLGGGCSIPFGAYARIEEGRILLNALFVRNGKVKKTFVGGEEPYEVAEKAYQELL